MVEKLYNVYVPITGIAFLQVKANSEKEAKELVFEEPLSLDNVTEFEIHEYICQGNVFYGIQNSIEVELSEEEYE